MIAEQVMQSKVSVLFYCMQIEGYSMKKKVCATDRVLLTSECAARFSTELQAVPLNVRRLQRLCRLEQVGEREGGGLECARRRQKDPNA